MRIATRGLVGAFCLTLLHVAAASGQDGAAVRAEIASKIQIAGDKLISLAEATPQDKLLWRPGEGVRSASEVFMHVVGTNYWFPTMLGATPPASSKVTADYGSVPPLEQVTDRAAIVASLRASFQYLVAFARNAPADRLDEPVNMFGQNTTYRDVLLETTTHLHEHLGQSIAYARVNGVVPPWSG